METITQNAVINNQAKEPLNHAKAEIHFRFAELNLREKTAILEVRTRNYRGRKWFVKLITVRVSQLLYNWFAYQNPYNDKDGKPTGLYLSGYQRWLLNNNMDVKTPLTTVSFQSENHSEDYYANPFKLMIYKQYNQANMTLVYMPNMKKISRHNPVTGEIEQNWIYKKNKHGRMLTLPKKYYKRLEIR